MAQVVKNLPATWETLAWEDPLEKEMSTQSSILAWEIPRTEDPGGLQFLVSESDMTEHEHKHEFPFSS